MYYLPRMRPRRGNRQARVRAWEVAGQACEAVGQVWRALVHARCDGRGCEAAHMDVAGARLRGVWSL